jgi:hypothetical protein
MIRLTILFCLSLLSMFSQGQTAETILWKGNVNADGTPSTLVTLKLHNKYQIRVSGFVNLGKWIQNKEELANDACYEFNKETPTSKLKSFRNSHEIDVCDGNYHADHSYISKPFVADQDRIHFWIYDNYYDDNHGVLQVEVLDLGPEN